MEQGSLLVNEQCLFKLFRLAINTSAFIHLLVRQAGQGKLEKLYIACESEAKSLCCAYAHLPYRSQRVWKQQYWSESRTSNPSKLLSKITTANDPKNTMSSMNFASYPLAIFQAINERFLQSHGNVVPLMSFGMEICQTLFENSHIFCPHAYYHSHCNSSCVL